jgi:hypothetical protein
MSALSVSDSLLGPTPNLHTEEETAITTASGYQHHEKMQFKKVEKAEKGKSVIRERYEEGERCEREKRNQEVVKHIHLKMPQFGSCKTLPVIQDIRQDQSRRRLRAHLHSVLHQARWRVTNERRVLVKQQHAVTGLIDQ